MVVEEVVGRELHRMPGDVVGRPVLGRGDVVTRRASPWISPPARPRAGIRYHRPAKDGGSGSRARPRDRERTAVELFHAHRRSDLVAFAVREIRRPSSRMSSSRSRELQRSCCPGPSTTSSSTLAKEGRPAHARSWQQIPQPLAARHHRPGEPVSPCRRHRRHPLSKR